MSSVDRNAREKEVIRLLDEWPWASSRATVIGGYALAAYGAARYSNDIDFTLPNGQFGGVEVWLASKGFEQRRRTLVPEVPFENAHRFKRDDVTIDLLIGFVRDREAVVDVPEHWVAMRPRKLRLELITGRTVERVTVARPEALWALKLQSGRPQDLIDLFSIRDEPTDEREVLELFESLQSRTLREKLAKVARNLSEPKLYNDARARLGMRNEPPVQAEWREYLEKARRMISFPSV